MIRVYIRFLQRNMQVSEYHGARRALTPPPLYHILVILDEIH